MTYVGRVCAEATVLVVFFPPFLQSRHQGHQVPISDHIYSYVVEFQALSDNSRRYRKKLKEGGHLLFHSQAPRCRLAIWVRTAPCPDTVHEKSSLRLNNLVERVAAGTYCQTRLYKVPIISSKSVNAAAPDHGNCSTATCIHPAGLS